MKATAVENPPVIERLAARITTTGERRPLDVFNAMTGDRLGSVPHCTPADVEEAGRRAAAVQQAWAARPVRDRAGVK